MLQCAPKSRQTYVPGNGNVVLELSVRNHPGVMSHICGLFARRAYNVEGIACLPVGDGSFSRIWLLVGGDQRLDQIVKQVAKLEDVCDVNQQDGTAAVFNNLSEFLSSEGLD